jgi:SAM-dependent methyltransferase
MPMSVHLTDQDRSRIEASIREKYARVALGATGLFRYPTGVTGLRTLNYDPAMLKSLPETVLESFCGVGNPFSLGEIRPGESVLDIGCGGGVDTLIAATMAGPTGRAVGTDMSHEMVERAKRNLSLTDLTNVTFHEVSAETLPFPDADFDVVISSGVFNLIPDKLKALEEVYRVMKPDGRLMMADQVLTGHLSEDIKARLDNWAG